VAAVAGRGLDVEGRDVEGQAVKVQFQADVALQDLHLWVGKRFDRPAP